jgi:RNA ligase (TIGR02306 family)
MRKLATIQRVVRIDPIPNAEKIEKLTVLGWELVSQKGNFKAGELGVYLEPDSLIPTLDPRFAFLDKDAQLFAGERRFRLRVIKLRKQVSSGLMLPLSDFPELQDKQEGDDVTDILNVKLYESPAEHVSKNTNLGKSRARNFPTHLIPKTEEERCCNGDTLIYTEDGTKSIREICNQKYSGNILTFNHQNNIMEYKPVIGWSIISALDKQDTWIKITLLSGKQLIVTKSHKIWDDYNNLYKDAGEFKIGDRVKVIKENDM